MTAVTGMLAAMLAAPASASSGPTVGAGPHLGHAQPAAPTSAQCEQLYGLPCYGPDQIRAAYNLPALYRKKITGRGTTIAIVDPFGSPTIRTDLAVFDRQFGYPEPPSFDIVAPAGQIPAYDANNPTMVIAAAEASLDVEYAHALAPDANILLVETPVAETEGPTGFPEIVTAEKYVIDHGAADVISQSFGATEGTFTGLRQLAPLRAAYLDANAHHVTVLASSGDSGAAGVDADGNLRTSPATSWPASDPLVTGVGGTKLTSNGRRFTSVAWNDTNDRAVNEHFAGDAGPNPAASGGGVSEFFARPRYQDSVRAVVGDRRGVPDVAMSAAASEPVLVYTSFGGLPSGWQLGSGTSEGTPEFAAIVALADQVAGHPLGLINPTLYALAARHAPGIVDVTSGDNTVSFRQAGRLVTVPGFPAGPGHDLVTGVGTIDALPLVYELAGSGAPDRACPAGRCG